MEEYEVDLVHMGSVFFKSKTASSHVQHLIIYLYTYVMYVHHYTHNY